MDVIGIDHIYIAVSNMAESERFYDIVLMNTLGFRKNTFALDDNPHIQYFNRHFGYVLRPANSKTSGEGVTVGLHHFCFRVDSIQEVHEVSAQLQKAGIAASNPKCYPEYAPDYWATFFNDPDAIRLEVTNYRQERRDRNERWESLG